MKNMAYLGTNNYFPISEFFLLFFMFCRISKINEKNLI